MVSTALKLNEMRVEDEQMSVSIKWNRENWVN